MFFKLENRRLYCLRIAGFIRYVLVTDMIPAVFAGCSTEHYKAEADKEVYSIIAGKWQKSYGGKSKYIINDSNIPASPNDIHIEIAVLPILWEAGRMNARDYLESQDDLLQAQNNVTSALVSHAIAKLNFFRDVGILQIKPDGMWGRENNE